MLAFLLSAHSTSSHALPQRRASARKFRLLACASCRRIDSLLVDNRSRWALQVSERFADELASEQELNEAWEAAAAAAQDLFAGKAVSDSYMAGVFGLPFGGERAMALAARAAAQAASRLAPEAAVSSAFDAAVERGVVPGARDWAVEALGAPARLSLLRDVFGNPFRSVVVAPEWRTQTVLAIARGAYLEQAFERVAILADALEEAGCHSVELLEHCRAQVLHVLGCWALDLVLGKGAE
jgi:hypothetical protein